MDAFLGLFGLLGLLIGLLWLIYAVIKHRSKKRPLLLLVIGFLFVVIGFSLSPPDENTTAESEKSSQKAKTNADNTGKKITINSNKSVKQAINQYAGNIKVIETNGNFIGHDDLVQVTIQAGSKNVTDKLHTFEIYSGIAKVWKALCKSDLSQIKKVNVAVKDKLKDQDGNVDNVYVIKSEVSADKIKKMDPERFVAEDVPTYADSWYQDDALAKYN